LTLTVEVSDGKSHEVTLTGIPEFKKYVRKLYLASRKPWIMVKANREPLFLVGDCGERVYESAFSKEE
jgi:hypothetical protein